MEIPITKIAPNPDQPRKHFDPDDLAALAATIREHGILQPVTVYQVEDGYILEDGERRWRAAQLAGLSTISAHVLPPKPGGYDSLVRAAIANIQRSRLTPSEEGQVFERLRGERHWSLSRIAAEFQVCQALVKNRLAISQLEEPIRQWIDQDQLPSDQRVVEALLTIPDAQMRLALAGKLSERKASIQVCLAACKKLSAPKPKQQSAKAATHNASPERKAAWNALSQTGKLPPWPLFTQAVTHACQETCNLAGEAGNSICKDCPMAIMVTRLIETAAPGTPAAWPVKQPGGRRGGYARS